MAPEGVDRRGAPAPWPRPGAARAAARRPSPRRGRARAPGGRAARPPARRAARPTARCSRTMATLDPRRWTADEPEAAMRRSTDPDAVRMRVYVVCCSERAFEAAAVTRAGRRAVYRRSPATDGIARVERPTRRARPARRCTGDTDGAIAFVDARARRSTPRASASASGARARRGAPARRRLGRPRCELEVARGSRRCVARRRGAATSSLLTRPVSRRAGDDVAAGAERARAALSALSATGERQREQVLRVGQELVQPQSGGAPGRPPAARG